MEFGHRQARLLLLVMPVVVFCGGSIGGARISAEKVTVAEREFRRFPAILAVSGHQITVEGSVFDIDHFP